MQLKRKINYLNLTIYSSLFTIHGTQEINKLYEKKKEPEKDYSERD